MYSSGKRPDPNVLERDVRYREIWSCEHTFISLRVSNHLFQSPIRSTSRVPEELTDLGCSFIHTDQPWDAKDEK
jgi:hypothetical protein